jgi:uncharacterized protein
MASRIREDHHEFRQVVSGKVREELKKFIRTGKIFRQRGKDGRIGITIPRIDLPHFVFGKPKEGVGRGPGNKGDIIGQDPDKGKGGKAGEDPAEGITVSVDLEYILKMLKEELQLPNLKPKHNQTYEEERFVYNGISKIGPNSLLHKRKTLRETMKRMAALGTLDDKVVLQGLTEPVPVLLPINDDRRYRQYNVKKKPSNNALIVYMRDGSGSMDPFKCDIVSDICWWLDLYIRSYYKKTESLYIWHDTEAKIVSQDVFYNLRYGGGTKCSSALQMFSKLIDQGGRYPPTKWNIYGFYFGDGENQTGDNPTFCKLIRKDLSPDKVNLFGVTQILHAWQYEESLKAYVDHQIEQGKLYADHVRTTSVDKPEGVNWNEVVKDDEKRDEAIRKALKDLLGKDAGNKKVKIEEII